jgi:hypothetical protein
MAVDGDMFEHHTGRDLLVFSRGEITKIFSDERHAIGQLGAQYKYVSELIEDIAKIEAEEADEKKREFQTMQRLWRALSRAERDEYHTEQRIIHAFEDLKERIPKDRSLGVAPIFNEIITLLQELNVIEQKLMVQTSRYTGSLGKEFYQIEKVERAIEAHKVKEEYLPKILASTRKSLLDLKRWIAGAQTLLKNIISDTQKLGQVSQEIEERWKQDNPNNPLTEFRNNNS